jgi:hypothetical protein
MENNIIPIYTSKGDALAFLHYPYIHNQNGEWIGFVNARREVYSVLGYYVGILTSDPRIIRNMSGDCKPRLNPPAPPTPLRISATIPLARLMSDLSHENVDVLLEDPELLHTLDAGELRPDLD